MEELKKWVGHKRYVAIMLAAVIAVVCFLTACQPTPPKPIVQNKNDEDLKVAIAQTATPIPSETYENADATTTSQFEESVEPIAYVEDISSNASTTVTVDIHAEVINNQPDNIPVAKITSYKYSQEEIMHMIEVFFGNTEMYTLDYTKEDYDYVILQKQYELNDPDRLQAYADDRNITDLNDAKENIQAAIDRFIESREEAPDERITTDYETALNAIRGFNVLVKTDYGFWGRAQHGKLMTAFNDDDIYYRSRDLYPCEYIEPDCCEEEFLNAKGMAIQMVADMGIDNVVFCDAFMSQDYSDNDIYGKPYWNGKEYYVFCFDTIVGESVIDNTRAFFCPPSLIDMSGKDGYEDVPAILFDEMLPYESLEVWVEEDRIVQFRQRYPIQVTETLNDNVAINVDYNEAVELAKQYAHAAYIDPYERFAEFKLDIYKIELVLIRIREKDTGDYIVVPVWNFCGAYLFKYCDEDYVDPDENGEGWAVRQGVEGTSDVLITINALDGTVIDLSHGY